MAWYDWILDLFGVGRERPTPVTFRPIVLNDLPYPSQVRLEAGGVTYRATTFSTGRAAFAAIPTSVTTANLFITAVDNDEAGAPGFEWYGQVIEVPRDKNEWWAIEIPAAYERPLPQGWYQLPVLLVATRPFPAERGLIHIDGTEFRDDSGAYWQSRSHTDFLLFFKFLKGEDIQAILTERINLGFNCLRVLGMVAWERTSGLFYPQNWPDYYVKLSDFADTLAERGIRVEFLPFADAQIVMPNENEQQTHFNKCMETLAGKWNVFIEVANEPFKNIPGGGERCYEIGSQWKGRTPLLIASGAGVGDIAKGDFDALARMSIDYVTIHDHHRGSEWPRKMKDVWEVRRGLRNRWPVLMNEPIGADETNQPGRRSNVPSDFRDAAALLALQTPGGTFHSQAGLDSFLLGPIQYECAKAWNNAMMFIGPVWQTGMYTAGHLRECPIEHSDDTASRTYAQILGNLAMVVVVRPTSEWRIQLKDNWQVETYYTPNIFIVRR